MYSHNSHANQVGRRRIRLTVGLLAVALLTAACGASGSTPATDATGSSSTVTQAGQRVTIDTFMFTPKTLHVSVGDTVTWTNYDSILHTVTSGTRQYEPGNGGQVATTHKDGTFDMQLDGKGATTSFTFTKAGSFHYFCDRHPGMEADIEVS